MVALGAALLGLIVLNYLDSREGESAVATLHPPASSARGGAQPDEQPAALPPAGAVRAPSSPAEVADATGAGDGVNAEPYRAPVLLPNQVSATPMSEALETLQLPPIPELLETEREFAAQNADPAWATATEARILGQFAGVAGLELASLDVECRTTLCRIQLVRPGSMPGPPSAVFPSPGRAPNGVSLTDLIPATGLKSLWVIAVRDRHGTPVSLAYLERVAAVQ